MSNYFNFEQRLFLKQLNIKFKDDVINSLENMEPDDEFSEEFIRDLIKKVKNVNETELIY